jgi:hypothetical protein
MIPITDFDPLQCLADLQQGLISLSESQQLLIQNQQKLQQALDLLCESQRRLDQRQDILAQVWGLVISEQKCSPDPHAK